MTVSGLPVIPENVTVHLGAPGTSAPNVTLPFADYIANVASSEIYPTWPENAIRANVYAQISYTLNRIYTEFYRSRGYDFDITNSIANDQSFVNGREIFSNVRAIVDDIFNDYLRRQGTIEPLFAQYCDGVEVTCDGLSQWGTVTLANQGLTPYEIVQNYYGNNVDIVQNAPVGEVGASAPANPLRLGSFGEDVRLLQIRLNRISNNYPGIPKIAFTDGIFTYDTEAAVKAFQEIFDLTPDGIAGNATWYAVLRIYNAVKRLNSLTSEGLQFEELPREFSSVLSSGDRGRQVAIVQYYIDYLSAYYDTIPPLTIDGVFGEDTRNAVLAVQRTFGLAEDGILGEATWNAIANAYYGIISRIPVTFTEGNIVPYQGIVLRQGAEAETVRILQEYLNYISEFVPEIPAVSPTGYFGPQTQRAVEAFQRLYGLPVTGYVEAVTWNGIADLYSDLFIGNRLNDGQFPGTNISG